MGPRDRLRELSLRGSSRPEPRRLALSQPAVSLILSGHTHGGQVKVRDPEKRVLRRRKLTSGLHLRNESQIYITRGIGTVVLPIRYQCPPEISFLELRSV